MCDLQTGTMDIPPLSIYGEPLCTTSFHQLFGFLGAGPMSLDALQGQVTCQHT